MAEHGTTDLTALQEQVRDLQRQLETNQFTDARETQVEAVSLVKTQPFSKDQPQLWFMLLEAQFAARKITSERTMYNNTLANLSTEIALQVESIISTPYEDGQYGRLKDALHRAYSIFSTEKFQKLVSREELGDQKPSHLLQRLRSYADRSIGDDFIKKLWLNRLPNTSRVILSTSTDTLDKLAIMADTIHENSDNLSVNAVSSKERQSLSDVIAGLTEEVAKLTAKVNSMETQRKSRRDSTPNRFRSRSRNSNRSRSNTNDSDMCWYHQKYGSDAKNCNSPCAYKSKN